MEERYHAKSPEDEGIPDVDSDLRRRRLIEMDEDLPIPADDRPLGAYDRPTVVELREDETVNTRRAREVPDEPHKHRRHDVVGRLYEEPGEAGRDVIKELVAEETDDTAGLSPEEAAMHIEFSDDEDET
jgi:uncharacterized protein DUF5709